VSQGALAISKYVKGVMIKTVFDYNRIAAHEISPAYQPIVNDDNTKRDREQDHNNDPERLHQLSLPFGLVGDDVGASSARSMKKAVRRLRRRRLPANKMHGRPAPDRGARPCDELAVKSR
jgi:hypothetical protein